MATGDDSRIKMLGGMEGIGDKNYMVNYQMIKPVGFAIFLNMI